MKFFHTFTLYIFFHSFFNFLYAPLNYQGLCDHMKLFHKIERTWHRGDPYAHSIWVAKAIDQWFDEESEWTEGLESYRKLLVLAGFLHDIGKFGDSIFTFKEKVNHPEDGFNYLLGKKVFLVESQAFDFDDYLAQNAIVNEEDKKLIAILIGIHWEFGGVIIQKLESNPTQNKNQLFIQFLEKLQNLVNKTHYNNGVIDEILLKMSVLIAAADWKGLSPIEYSSSLFPELENEKASNEFDKDFFIYFKRDEIGLRTRKELLKYFKTSSFISRN